MACHECMTHTNPEPCCPHERNFGEAGRWPNWQPFGYDLAHPVNPPWLQTLALAALTYFSNGARKYSPASDIRFMGTMGTVVGPASAALLWYRYKNPVM